MTERKNLFTAQEFAEKLRRGDSEAPAITLTGLIKLPGDDSEQIMFAFGTRCADWTPVPLAVIESIEVLRDVTCSDHSHPLVSLTLEAPRSAEAATFAALLAASVKLQQVQKVVLPRGSVGQGTPLRTRLHFGENGTVISAPTGGGCAVTCNQFEVDVAGNIFELYSCQDLGGGAAICYYQ
jgi:hypothetical protein